MFQLAIVKHLVRYTNVWPCTTSKPFYLHMIEENSGFFCLLLENSHHVVERVVQI